MNGFHGGNRQPATIASAGSKSIAVRVDGANMVSIELPAFGTLLATTTANVYIEGCQTADGTFRRVMDEGNYSAGAAIADWEIPSSTGDRIVMCRPARRFNYIKVHLSTAATDGITPYIHIHQ